MLDLFYAGGPLFMGILLLLLLATIGAKFRSPQRLKTMGNLAIGCGFFAFAVGLFQLFEAVEAAQVQIHPALLAGGLKNAIIAPMFGMLIYMLANILKLLSSD